MIDRMAKFVDVYGIGLIAYLGVSFCSALVEWSTFAVALTMMSPVQAACAGFVVATSLNSVLSRRFAFSSCLGWFSELALMTLANAAVFVWNLTVFYLLYKFLAVPLFIAKIIGTIAGFVINYSARQFWIFSRLPRYASMSRQFTIGLVRAENHDANDGIRRQADSRGDA